MSNGTARIILVLIVLLCVVVGAPKVILGGAQYVRLSSAPSLAGQVSQALGPGPDGSLPAVNKDYALSVQRFSESDWVVADVEPMGSAGGIQNGYVVMKRNAGIFQVVFGPGTAISSAQLSVFPPDVNAYLQKHVPSFNPIVGQ